MATRSLAHAKQEKTIFEAFLVAYPSFAKVVKKFDQPDPFPDIEVELTTGGFVYLELGEWLCCCADASLGLIRQLVGLDHFLDDINQRI